MKQTKNTCVVSGRRRGGGVLARQRKGSSSHSGEWRGGGLLSGPSARRRQSLALGPGHDRLKNPKPLLSA